MSTSHSRHSSDRSLGEGRDRREKGDVPTLVGCGWVGSGVPG